MSIVSQTLATGTLLLDITILAGIFLYGAKRLLGFNFPEQLQTLEGYVKSYSVELSFGLATIATAGSLYYSNILQYEPCRLCWFQRIFMYPLVLILGVGLLFDDDNVADYALPLTMIGLPIAFYHSLVQRYSQFHSSGCSIFSVSCSTEYTFYFGYITIPVMATIAFLGILILLWRFKE
jgi:disulfide bond formation protein DsbB